MTNENKEAFDVRFEQEMTRAAGGMLRVGVMTEEDYKLTVRDLKRATQLETLPLPSTAPRTAPSKDSAPRTKG